MFPIQFSSFQPFPIWSCIKSFLCSSFCFSTLTVQLLLLSPPFFAVTQQQQSSRAELLCHSSRSRRDIFTVAQHVKLLEQIYRKAPLGKLQRYRESNRWSSNLWSVTSVSGVLCCVFTCVALYARHAGLVTVMISGCWMLMKLTVAPVTGCRIITQAGHKQHHGVLGILDVSLRIKSCVKCVMWL